MKRDEESCSESSCRASVVKGEEAIRFCEVAGVYTVAVGFLRSAVDTSTADSRVTITTLGRVFLKIFFYEIAACSYML